MVDYKYEDLYYQDSIHKQLKIEVEDGTVITNEDIFAESMVLTENLCTDTNLSFGSCEASKFEIKIANQFYSMKGLWLDVSETLTSNEPAPPQEANSILGEMVLGAAVLGYDGENWHPDHLDAPFVFGRYKVASDRPTADRSFRQIVAYDALYDIINADVADVAEWYETLLPKLDSTVTLKEFRDSFFEHFDIEQKEVSLPNDDVIIEKTISSASLSGKEVVTAICELNGCFGHIGRDGKFHYIFLPEISDGNSYALACDDSLFIGSPEFADSNTAVLGYSELGKMQLGLNEIPETIAMDIISTPFSEDSQLATEIGKENWQYIDYEDYVTHPIDSLQIRDCTEDAGYTYDLGTGGNNYIIDGNFLLYGKSNEELHDIAKKIFEKISVVTYRPTDATLRGNPCFEVGDTIMLESKYQTICTYILSRTLTGIQALKDDYVSTGNETYENSYNGISYEIDQLKGITNIFERNVESNTLKIENLDGQISTIEQTLDSISFSVKGSLGGTASIILKVGDEALEGDIDLSDVREAFAEEKSSIEIAAGVITFASNTLIVESDNFKLSSDGFITAKNATIEGAIVAESLTVYDRIIAYNSDTETSFNVMNWVTSYGGSESSQVDEITIGQTGAQVDIINLNVTNAFIAYGPTITLEPTTGYAVRIFPNNTLSTTTSSILDVWGSITSYSHIYTNGGQFRASFGYGLYIEDHEGSYRTAITITGDGATQYNIATGGVANNIYIGTTGNTNTLYLRGSTIAVQGALTGNSTLTMGNRVTINTTNTTGLQYTQTASSSSGGAAYITVIQDWSKMQVRLGIGDGGENRGIYDYTSNTSLGSSYSGWILYRTSTSNNGEQLRIGVPDDDSYVVVNEYAQFYPYQDDDWDLGHSGRRWNRIYCTNTSISTSDERDKENITTIDEKYENLFMKFKPVNYMWKNFTEKDNHDRIHCGLIAQDVEEACESVGLNSMTFAALCHDDLKEEGSDGLTDRYGMAYSELHGLEIHMIQKNVNNIEELQKQLEEAKERISQLESKMNVA